MRASPPTLGKALRRMTVSRQSPVTLDSGSLAPCRSRRTLLRTGASRRTWYSATGPLSEPIHVEPTWRPPNTGLAPRRV